MNSDQAQAPGSGVCVFGSSTIRVTPDITVVDFAATRASDSPREAVRAAAEAAKTIRAHLESFGLTELSVSGPDVEQRYVRRGSETEQDGYTARMNFSLLLRNAKRTEELAISLVEAGANVIKSVDHQTSKLKSIRAEARIRATRAAREKAEQYCQAACVTLSGVLGIEDLNPDVLRYSRSAHDTVENHSDDGVEPATNDPRTILVRAAVRVTYAIEATNGDA